MRYSRIRRKRRQRNYARFLLIGIVLFVAVYIISAGAIGKRLSDIIAPRLSAREDESKDSEVEKDMESQQTDEKEKDEKEPDEKKVKKISETIKVEPLSIFAIQMGAFSTEENANELAEEIQTRSGGGYIIKDEYYRVLAVGYMAEGDTNKVKEQLKEQNIESQVYRISCPGANMQVTASAEKIEGVKSAYSLWRAQIEDMENIVKDLDGQAITGDKAHSKIVDMRDEMEDKLSEIREYKAAEESGAILSGLENIYKEGLSTLDKLIEENYQNEVAFSSKIKYTYIEMIYIYKNYMDGIVNT